MGMTPENEVPRDRDSSIEFWSGASMSVDPLGIPELLEDMPARRMATDISVRDRSGKIIPSSVVIIPLDSHLGNKG